MKSYERSHLADQTLAHHLASRNARICDEMAEHLADLGEFDFRKLYLPVGHPSMFRYCMGELHLCEQAAYKRIRAARTARRFPAVFHAVAEGRLHLSAVVLLAPHLTEDNRDELLAAATHRSKSEIERSLAERFPRPDLPTTLEALSPPLVRAPIPHPAMLATQAPPRIELSPGTVPSSAPARIDVPPAHSSVPARIEYPPARITPLAPGRFGWQLTVGQETQDLLRDVEDLLGHDVPPGDMEAVLNFALRAAKQQLERRKFAATDRPRVGHRRSNPDGRHIPDEVRRAVWQRDGGRCTFTSDTGHRCEERKDLQFDHVDPYARGGEATVGGIRLLCRAHNQFEAERVFGAEFIRHSREAARDRASKSRGEGRARPAAAS